MLLLHEKNKFSRHCRHSYRTLNVNVAKRLG
uniref:Uncharacterized protein n=1 Tax=Rhizophora mucronata TaxID=61149 RepID=A0A2P2PEJ0_RHIMU